MRISSHRLVQSSVVVQEGYTDRRDGDCISLD
jgi:hypothetical protein